MISNTRDVSSGMALKHCVLAASRHNSLPARFSFLDPFQQPLHRDERLLHHRQNTACPPPAKSPGVRSAALQGLVLLHDPGTKLLPLNE